MTFPKHLLIFRCLTRGFASCGEGHSGAIHSLGAHAVKKMVPHPRGGFAFFQAEGMFLRKTPLTRCQRTERLVRSSQPLTLLSFPLCLFFCGCISVCGLRSLPPARFLFRVDLQDPVPHSQECYIVNLNEHNCLYKTCSVNVCGEEY